MSKCDTNWFQLDRYYTFEGNEQYCVGYFYRGTNCQNTEEFHDQAARAAFVRNQLPGFRHFKP